jgi:hypothetical protein
LLSNPRSSRTRRPTAFQSISDFFALGMRIGLAIIRVRI